MNGANGMSDMEGKAGMGSGQRRESGASFNTNFYRFRFPESWFLSVFHLCKSVAE
jgi:hypothetical protein